MAAFMYASCSPVFLFHHCRVSRRRKKELRGIYESSTRIILPLFRSDKKKQSVLAMERKALIASLAPGDVQLSLQVGGDGPQNTCLVGSRLIHFDGPN
jgi:hypothetical protein